MKLGLGAKGQDYAGYYRVKIYDQNRPVIEKYTASSDGEVTIEAAASDISFRITDVSYRQFEGNHGVKTKFFFTMDLGEDNPSRLSMNLNNLTKNILNSLANVEDLHNAFISLRVYTSESGYATPYMEVNGERSDWKFNVDQIKGMKTDDAWIKMAEKFVIPQFDIAPKTIEGPEGMELQLEETAPANEETDDLPF